MSMCIYIHLGKCWQKSWTSKVFENTKKTCVHIPRIKHCLTALHLCYGTVLEQKRWLKKCHNITKLQNISGRQPPVQPVQTTGDSCALRAWHYFVASRVLTLEESDRLHSPDVCRLARIYPKTQAPIKSIVDHQVGRCLTGSSLSQVIHHSSQSV